MGYQRGGSKVWLLVVVAVCLGGGGVLWLLRAQPPKTLEDLSEEVQAQFRGYLEAARKEIDAGRWAEAEPALLSCLSLYEGEPEVHSSLAHVYFSKRLHADPSRLTEAEEDALVDKALASLQRALDLDPGYIPALMGRFQILGKPAPRRYDPDGALEDAEAILRAEPQDTNFRQMLIVWLFSGARFQRSGEGRVAFDSAIGLEKAESHIQQMLDTAPAGSPAYVDAHRWLGLLHLLGGDFQQAADTYQKLVGFSLPKNDEARSLTQLGLALFHLGRSEEAASAYLIAMESRKTLEGTWLLRLAYEAMGRDPSDLPKEYLFNLPPEAVDPATPPKLRFTEIGEALGVARKDGAGPSAFADFDGDGDPDILAAGCDSFTALYRNDGEKFTDVTGETGLQGLESGFSTNLVDYDDDGLLDIYICRAGWSGDAPNLLFRNKGDGTFEDRSKESGLDDGGCGFISLWSDFDRDGLLDVFIVNGVYRDGHTNRLYRNQGNGTFADETQKSGLAESRRWGSMGVAVGDYDRDGDPDIFLNGREEVPNRLYRNRGDGTFDEVWGEAGVATPPHEGHVAFFIDYNNDTHPDILATSLARWRYVLNGLSRRVVAAGPEEVQRNASRLFRNQGDGTFVDATFESGLFFPHGVVGGGVADLDNDGFTDIYLGTGDPNPLRLESSVFYRNNGDGTFSDLTRYAGLGDLGKGHGYSFADLDLDGDLDIYAPQGGVWPGDLQANPFHRNDGGTENHWLHLRLRGVKSNRFAVGAQVTVKAGGMTQYREVEGGSGFGSTNSYPVEFGLGERTQIDEVEIVWPNGERQTLKSPPVDALIDVVEGEGGWKVIHRGE